MQLSSYRLRDILAGKVIVPDEKIFELPEKVLQFGTGILLRGLPDYFIDKANRLGIFNGSILVVKSTAGPVEGFERHQFQFTTCVRGIRKGRKIEVNNVNSAHSRAVSEQQQF